MPAQISQISGHFSRLARLSVFQKCCKRYNYNLASIQGAESAQYPPTKPRYPPGTWDEQLSEEVCWQFHQEGEDLKAIPRVKERLEAIAGSANTWMSMVQPFEASPRIFGYKQYITKTHLVPDILPNIYSTIDTKRELEIVKPLVMEAIAQEHDMHYKRHLVGGRRVFKDEHRAYRSHYQLRQIINVILSSLCSTHEHFFDSILDEDVRVESFWYKTFRQENIKQRGLTKEKILTMQAKYRASFQLRSKLPLPEFVSFEDELSTQGKVPKIDYGPNTIFQIPIHERPISVSGHWIGDPCEFGQASFHALPSSYDLFTKQFGDRFAKEFSLQYGLVTAFTYCLAQAHNQGFTKYHDVTYPFTTQSVVSDGQIFRFMAYQLNTFQLWKDLNPLNNILWTTDEQKLYDTVENGQVKGFNDEVLKQLLRMFLLKPVDRGIDLRPYLPEEETPSNKKLFINHVGDEPLEEPKIGRWQYPRNAVYF